MNESQVGVDDELLAELGAVLRPRLGPPDHVVQGARGLFTWRTVDAELAELSYDSLLDDDLAADRGAAALRSGGDQSRLLSFVAGELTIEVEVRADRDGRRLVGQVLPPVSGTASCRSATETVEAAVDDLGRFAVALPGAARSVVIAVRPDGGEMVETAAVVL